MAVLGMAGGALALVAAGYLTFGWGTDTVALVVFAGLTMIPSTILWLSGNWYRRGNRYRPGCRVLHCNVRCMGVAPLGHDER